MKRECAELAELLSALADGELEASARERVERHLAGCPDCRRLAESFRRLDGALTDFPPPPAVEESRWEGMLAEVRRAGATPGGGVAGPEGAVEGRRAVLRPAPGRAWRLVIVGVLAAAAAVVLAIALLPRGGRVDYRSAESVSVDATGDGCQALVMIAPEGGLNMVMVTSEAEPEDFEERAGG